MLILGHDESSREKLLHLYSGRSGWTTRHFHDTVLNTLTLPCFSVATMTNIYDSPHNFTGESLITFHKESNQSKFSFLYQQNSELQTSHLVFTFI